MRVKKSGGKEKDVTKGVGKQGKMETMLSRTNQENIKFTNN